MPVASPLLLPLQSLPDRGAMRLGPSLQAVCYYTLSLVVLLLDRTGTAHSRVRAVTWGASDEIKNVAVRCGCCLVR
jgi:hypothetical protein